MLAVERRADIDLSSGRARRPRLRAAKEGGRRWPACSRALAEQEEEARRLALERRLACVGGAGWAAADGERRRGGRGVGRRSWRGGPRGRLAQGRRGVDRRRCRRRADVAGPAVGRGRPQRGDEGRMARVGRHAAAAVDPSTASEQERWRRCGGANQRRGAVTAAAVAEDAHGA
jgi:hypothetical protein